MQKVFSLVMVSLLVVLPGCTSLMGPSDYDSHTKARVEFKKSDDTRMVAQSNAIATLANKGSESKEAEAYKNALAMISVALLKNQDYNEQAPMTWTQVGAKVVDAVPFVAGVGGMYLLGKEGIRAAGNVTIGENSPVSGSFNKHQSTSFGEGQATIQPYEVRPEVVQPVVVEPQVVQPVIVEPGVN
jgi:hypothetical protein